MVKFILLNNRENYPVVKSILKKHVEKISQ